MTIHFNLRVVPTGEWLGPGNHDEPRMNHGPVMIEFYDPRYESSPLGEFVARFYVSDVLCAAPGEFWLLPGHPSMTLNPQQLEDVKETLRHMRSRRMF